MNNSLQQVITLLQSKHYSEEEIAAVTNDVIMEAYDAFLQKAKSLMMEDDLQKIEAMGDDSAEVELNRLYHERAGKDPKDEIREFLKQYAESLIAEYSDTSLHL